MDTKDVLGMLFERGNAMQTFWGFYITVAFGLIAFFGSGRRSVSLATLMSIVFLGFAVVNCDGMYDIARQRKALFQILDQQQRQSEEHRTGDASSVNPVAISKELVDASHPPPPTGVVAFHVFADIAVLAGIWYLTSRGRPALSEEASS
jgi:hypothetical protein